MREQVIFEFKKHFLKRSLIFALLLFLFLDAYQIKTLAQQKSVFSIVPEFKIAYEDLYSTYSGAITVEKIHNLMSLYDPILQAVNSGTASTNAFSDSLTFNQYSDELLLRWCFIEPMKHAYQYQNKAVAIAQQALNNLSLYKSTKNTYEYRKNTKIAALFAYREINEFYNTEMAQYFLQYDFSIFFVLLIIIAALTNVFILDKETRMECIMITTVLGSRQTVWAKLLASLLFIISVCFLFWLFDLIYFQYFFHGFQGGNLPLFAIKLFEFTPLRLSISHYILLSMLLKTLGTVVIGMFVILLSVLCNNTLLPFVGSLAFVFICLLLYSLALPVAFDRVLLLNPICLLVNRDLFTRTLFLNFADWPVSTGSIALVFAVILFILFLGSALKLNRRNYFLIKARKEKANVRNNSI